MYIRQPYRVNPFQWIPPDIGVGVDAAPEPNRIALDIPADAWIVIPVHVVGKVGLGVVVLPREPLVELEDTLVGWIFIGDIVPERVLVIPLPFYSP